MTRQEEFNYLANQAERISAKIYKLYCWTNKEEDQDYFLDSREMFEKTLEALKEEKFCLARIDEEELQEKDLIEHNKKISSLLERLEKLIKNNQRFLFIY